MFMHTLMYVVTMGFQLCAHVVCLRFYACTVSGSTNMWSHLVDQILCSCVCVPVVLKSGKMHSVALLPLAVPLSDSHVVHVHGCICVLLWGCEGKSGVGSG